MHRVQPYLGCCVVHHFLCGQVTLVAHQKLVNIFTGIAVNFLKPLLDIVIGLLHSDNSDMSMTKTKQLFTISYYYYLSLWNMLEYSWWCSVNQYLWSFYFFHHKYNSEVQNGHYHSLILFNVMLPFKWTHCSLISSKIIQEPDNWVVCQWQEQQSIKYVPLCSAADYQTQLDKVPYKCHEKLFQPHIHKSTLEHNTALNLKICTKQCMKIILKQWSDFHWMG